MHNKVTIFLYAIVFIFCFQLPIFSKTTKFDENSKKKLESDFSEFVDNEYQRVYEEQIQKYQDEQDLIVAPPPPPLSIYEISNIEADTNDQSPRSVKIVITLGYEMHEVNLAGKLIEKTEEIQKVCKKILQTKSYNDLNSPEKKDKLTQEFLKKINDILKPDKIKEVILKEFDME